MLKPAHFFVWAGILLIAPLASYGQDQDTGWETLFDGTSVEKWRGFKQQDFPHDTWEIVDGQLRAIPGEERVDLVTREMYSDFELVLEWKAPRGKKGNSGIFYHVTGISESITHIGPEIQILNDNHSWLEEEHSVPAPMRSAGALFALAAPNEQKELEPAGEYNEFRIKVRDRRAKVWLNGAQILDYDLNDEAMQERIAGSRFTHPRFGKEPEGHIALQHHGDEVWFRSIRIRRLPKE